MLLDERKNNILFIGEILLIVFSLFNTSRYGASLSWVIIPMMIIYLGGLFDFKNLNINLQSMFLLLFWAFAALSTAISEIMPIKRDIITFLIFVVGTIIINSSNHSRQQIKIMINTYIFVAVLGATNIILNWITKNYYVEYYMRSSFYFLGVFKDPNYSTAYIVPAVVFTIIKLVNKDRWYKRIPYLILVVIECLSFLAAGTRGSMVACIIALFVYFLSGIILKKYNFVSVLKMLLIIIVFMSITLYIALNYLSEQAFDRLFHANSDPRLKLWETALTMFVAHPLLGGGMGSVSVITNQIAGNYSHNVYIDILGNFGVVGMSLFAIYFVSSCVNSNKRDKDIIYGLTFAFMLPMFFINGFNTATFYLPLMLLGIFSKYSMQGESINDCL